MATHSSISGHLLRRVLFQYHLNPFEGRKEYSNFLLSRFDKDAPWMKVTTDSELVTVAPPVSFIDDNDAVKTVYVDENGIVAFEFNTTVIAAEVKIQIKTLEETQIALDVKGCGLGQYSFTLPFKFTLV